jgi:hypothetical protein
MNPNMNKYQIEKIMIFYEINLPGFYGLSTAGGLKMVGHSHQCSHRHPRLSPI